ncbi:MAG: stage III sporulation protein AE [Clostridia bacterium]|nr:stage III sporulation protein AE [Clostridia bacterium]
MKTNRVLIIFIIIITVLALCPNTYKVRAESLEESVNEQLERIDISELEEFYDSLKNNDIDFDVKNFITSVLSGDFKANDNYIMEFILNKVIDNLKTVIPSLLSIIAVSLLCVLLQNMKGKLTNESVSAVVDFSCLLVVVLILTVQLSILYENSKNTIENLSKLNMIMSPIILSLMIASGSTVSASVYKPTVLMFSNLVVNTSINILFPIVIFIVVLSVISSISYSMKFNKIIDFAKSIFKWIVGLVISIYGIFMTTQGIASSVHDGISLKAAKLISNSIPIVGGFLKNGFDFFIAGSVLIKNSLGYCAIIIMFIIAISPIISCVIYTLVLKLIAGISQTIKCDKISDLCTMTANGISLLNVVTILVCVMSFTTFLLMILSANAFL